MSNLQKQAEKYACNLHASVNHTYGGNPYSVHLQMVVDEVKEHLLTSDHSDSLKDEIIAAAWLHDTIEDCRVTYNDIKDKFGYRVAEIVYALTNEKGKTRKERANHVYYAGIRRNHYASIVKIADRIANTKFSKQSGSGMFEKYKSEAPDFIQELYSQSCFRMLKKLNEISEAGVNV